ncbi:hypothetical protein ACWKWK_02070 [Pseudoxanthomonas beigongshangi]
MNPLQTSDEILSRVESKGFLEGIFARDNDWDAALDARDDGAFDAAWHASDAQLGAHESSESRVSRSLRETVFKRVLALTGNAELAGHASDDFGLMAKAADAGASIPFVDGLWNAYRDGVFPRG